MLKLIRGEGGRWSPSLSQAHASPFSSPLLIPVRPLTLRERCADARIDTPTLCPKPTRASVLPLPSSLLCVGSVRLEQTLRKMTSSSIALRRASGEKEEKKERGGTGTPAAE